MQIGAILPQTDLGSDPAAPARFAIEVEAMGYDYLLAYDHVLGADLRARPQWRNRGATPHYTHESAFHEVFVLFGHLAALTQRLQFATGVLVLPQRQTALVAKQAAQVDLLSRGRLRLGVGIGWNDVEYQGMGMDFRNRGARSEEQIAALRALWTEDVVQFQGRWHDLASVGINPLPVQRPIPIFLGGQSEAALQRAARVADGCFMPMLANPATGALGRLHGHLREQGRTPESMALETHVLTTDRPVADWVDAASKWRDAGGTHVALNTLVTLPTGIPLPQSRTLDQHLAMLEAFIQHRERLAR